MIRAIYNSIRAIIKPCKTYRYRYNRTIERPLQDL